MLYRAVVEVYVRADDEDEADRIVFSAITQVEACDGVEQAFYADLVIDDPDEQGEEDA